MTEILNDQYFEMFKTAIYNQSGIHFTQSNRTVLESRLKERLRLHKITDLSLYYKMVSDDPEEMKTFLDSVTTNLTRFFRNASHYDTLIKYVIPELVEYKKKKGDRTFSIWSAGCSTGEEPYTNAMVLKENLPPGFKINVYASDLSLKSLMKAKEGFYPTNRVSGIPDLYLKKYMESKSDGFMIKDEIRDLVTFDYHNLKNENTFRNLDVLFCRNVLIYFDEAAQKNVVDQFWKTMSNHSYLFIGHSESLFGMNTQFDFLKTDWACLYTKLLDK